VAAHAPRGVDPATCSHFWAEIWDGRPEVERRLLHRYCLFCETRKAA
jgi:hypothetical protein